MSKVTRAIFPAAGLGTRFLPATKAIPKEMLPLVDKPLIQYAVEEAVASGLTDMVLVTSRGKSAMEDHFDLSFELENALESRNKTELLEAVRRVSGLANFSAVRQAEALGLGHAVKMAVPVLPPKEAAAILLADDVLDCEVPCLKQLMQAYEKVQAPLIAAMEVPEDQTSRYGIFKVEAVEGEERLLRIVDMVEKPKPGTAPSNLAAIGRYVVTSDVLEALDVITPGAGGELQLTDAFREVLKSKPVYAYKFEGNRYDGGDKLGFLQANVALGLKHPTLGAPFREILTNLLKDS